jgi:hypothetical protein
LRKVHPSQKGLRWGRICDTPVSGENDLWKKSATDTAPPLFLFLFCLCIEFGDIISFQKMSYNCRRVLKCVLRRGVCRYSSAVSEMRMGFCSEEYSHLEDAQCLI